MSKTQHYSKPLKVIHYGGANGYNWSHEAAFRDPMELIGKGADKRKAARKEAIERYHAKKNKS